MLSLLNEEYVERVTDALAGIKYEPTFRFALIGSRETDAETLDWMYTFALAALKAGAQGYSGGAEGADTQLTKAVQEMLKLKHPPRGYQLAKIFIGWYKFNGLVGGELDGAVIDGSKVSTSFQAQALAAALHPMFANLKPGAKALHTRNCFQILDEQLDRPVDAVFFSCNKLDNSGRPLGGTATAWKLAVISGIPTFNVSTKEGRDNAVQWVNEHLDENKKMLDIFNKGTAFKDNKKTVVLNPKDTVSNATDDDGDGFTKIPF